MSNDIKAGDLVAILNKTTCCDSLHKNHGEFFLVKEVYRVNSRFTCSGCGEVTNGALVCDSGDWYILAHFCRKIPPLSDLEDVSTKRQDLLPNEQESIV